MGYISKISGIVNISPSNFKLLQIIDASDFRFGSDKLFEYLKLDESNYSSGQLNLETSGQFYHLITVFNALAYLKDIDSNDKLRLLNTDGGTYDFWNHEFEIIIQPKRWKIIPVEPLNENFGVVLSVNEWLKAVPMVDKLWIDKKDNIILETIDNCIIMTPSWSIIAVDEKLITKLKREEYDLAEGGTNIDFKDDVMIGIEELITQESTFHNTTFIFER